jgi:Cu(I)/Ag(I) efflux system membrane fusion protein
MKKPARIIWPIAVLVVLAAFVVGFLAGRGGRTEASPADPSPPPAAAATQAVANAGGEQLPGTVTVDARKRQLIGIRVGPVEKAPFTFTLRVLGRVTADETRLYVVNAATTGWVVRIEPATPGSVVSQDEILAAFYAPELLGAQQAFLYAVNTLELLKDQPQTQDRQFQTVEVSVAQARDQLTNLGMGPRQIEELARTKERFQQVDMVSPTTGVVLSRNIYPGLKFVQGQEFFRIADLRRVWILADVFEGEDKYLRPGQKADVTLASQKLTFAATVSRILPLFDAGSRTLKVRLEADNPGYALRPDMFVDVEFPVESPAALAVPADAILDSGLRQTVFVEREEGVFEPREVRTGLRRGGRVEITAGLSPGERIALSGTFLIDSESRMDLAAAGLDATLARDPVSGAMVSIAKAEQAGRKSLYGGQAFYFASDENKEAFDKDPQKYASKPAVEKTPSAPPDPARDPDREPAQR